MPSQRIFVAPTDEFRQRIVAYAEHNKISLSHAVIELAAFGWLVKTGERLEMPYAHPGGYHPGKRATRYSVSRKRVRREEK